MKTLFAFLAALTLVVAVERPAQAASSAVTVDFFYDSLAPYGDWVEVEGYGYCFRPTVTLTDPGWRPYTEGSWIYTDAGWTWDSDEDFGWATYHYGRWLLVGHHWLWVPGDVWGPAWVSWRVDDEYEYAGWAPLPPEAVWTPNIGFSIHVDVHFDIGPSYYCFVPVRHLGDHHLRRHIEPWQRNIYYMRRTENCTRITHRSSGSRITSIFNEGPDFTRFARRTESPIRRMDLAVNESADFGDPRKQFRNLKEKDSFRVIAPTVAKVDTERRERKPAPDKIGQRLDRAQVNRGWQGFKEEEVRELRSEMQTAKRTPGAETKRPTDEAPERTPNAKPADQDTATTQRPQRRPDDKPAREAEAIQPEQPEADRKAPSRPKSKEEMRKAIPVIPEQKQDKPAPVRPDDQPPGKTRPTDPTREPRPQVPDKFRVTPQDAPPRSTIPRPDVKRPEDTPPGPLPKMKPGEDSGNSRRPAPDSPPKMKPDREKKDDRSPGIVPPQSRRPSAPPEARKIEQPKVEPKRVEPPKPERRKIEPRVDSPPSAPPPQLKRPDQGGKPQGKPGGGKKPDDDDDKGKKPR